MSPPSGTPAALKANMKKPRPYQAGAFLCAAICGNMEYRNTIDANWAKDEDSAFTNLYLDLQLIPTRRFRLAQPKDPKGV